jgi:trehalose-phosphatase
MTADLLAPLREAPERSALIFDVDGTLAPIVARPELAEVPPATKAELERLAGRYLLVAFVSGRSGEEARRLVGLGGVRYVGNHGLELDPGAHELKAQIAAFRDAVGRKVEDKGLTLSYHFREARDEAEARAELEEIARRATAEGLVPRWGRKVLEIRPAVEADKGTAVRSTRGTTPQTWTPSLPWPTGASSMSSVWLFPRKRPRRPSQRPRIWSPKAPRDSRKC